MMNCWGFSLSFWASRQTQGFDVFASAAEAALKESAPIAVYGGSGEIADADFSNKWLQEGSGAEFNKIVVEFVILVYFEVQMGC